MGFLLRINENDNVAVAIGAINKGECIAAGEDYITMLNDIPQGHKTALCDIKKDENIIKYGNLIGHALCDIKKGEHVHSHNLKTNLADTLEYTYSPKQNEAKTSPPQTFMGYRRDDGKAGIRNEIWIIPTVGCVNGIAKQLESMAEAADGIDGIYAFTHPFGCSQLGDDQKNTQKILAGLVRHPNAAAVLVLGLGCENNHIAAFKEVLGDYDANRVKFLECQGVSDELAAGMAIIEELTGYARKFVRSEMPTSELIVGLKCGGSDGYSGITANPMVGVFSDLLVAQGGTAILTEVPEMFGAETLLMARCQNQAVFEDTVKLINDFKAYYIKHNQVVYENPSPGNKAGGITTLEEKSLGCTAKSGSSSVMAVYGYGEPVTQKGLVLLSAPGNDLVASTALVASGAQLVLFTTGRGTPFGSPAPTVKIATNNQLFEKKSNWIDFNAGGIALGQDKESCAEDLLGYVIKLCSGEIETKSEASGYREISIFKDGVFL